MNGIGNLTGGEYCIGDFHVYPKTYAGNPEYAEKYFNTCLCGKKRKVTTTTVKEVDVNPTASDTKNKEG